MWRRFACLVSFCDNIRIRVSDRVRVRVVSEIFVLKTIRSLEHSLPGLFVPWNFRSRDRWKQDNSVIIFLALLIARDG